MSYTYCHLCTCEVKTVSSFLTSIPSAKSEACNDQRLLAFFKMHEDPDNGTIAHQSSSISSVQKGSCAFHFSCCPEEIIHLFDTVRHLT